MKNILNFIRKYQYIIYFLASFGIIDVAIRFQYRATAEYRFLHMSPTFFTIGISLMFLFIFLLLPKLIGKLFCSITLGFSIILLIVHNIIMDHLGTYFSFNLMGSAKDGMGFWQEYIVSIRPLTILTIIISIFLGILVILTYKEPIEKKYVVSIPILVLAILCIFIGYNFLGLKKGNQTYFSDSRTSNSRFSLTGLYVYTINDIALLFKEDDFDYVKAKENIEEYLKTDTRKYEKNDYSGIFKNKNLIFIQLENIDTWMINENNTPTIKYMMDNGINFNNNWTPAYSKGYTFTTEFVLNTGLVPELGISSAQSLYASNNFPHSLANSFKNVEYETNSYHYMWGTFYNRISNHKAWGYNKYHSFKDMNIPLSEYTMDRYLVKNGYEKIVKDNKFMSYIITYSPHMPFNEKKDECKKNLDFVKKHTKDTNIDYLCGLAQAHETDIFIAELLENLEKDNKLEDTVIVGFTDHYSYSNVYNEMVMKQKGITDELFKLMNTPFFIYNAGSKVFSYNNTTSPIDVIPTLLNMFGIKYEPKNYIGSDAFAQYKEKYIFFDERTWYDGNVYCKNEEAIYGVSEAKYIDEINKKINAKIEYSKNILKTNYFKK